MVAWQHRPNLRAPRGPPLYEFPANTTLYPNRPIVPLDTPGALREGLRCFDGFPPAPRRDSPKATRPREENPVIANALIITIAILLAIGFWLMGRAAVPHPLPAHPHSSIWGCDLLWVAVLFVNVFAAVYVVQRKFFLKDTGRKLSHIDKQAIIGRSSVPSPKDGIDEALP